MTGTDDVYSEVKLHFAIDETVEVNEGRGAQGIKFGKKMFIMFLKGDLLIQLSPDRVDELVAAGEAQSYDPGTGNPMKDRVLVPAVKRDTWITLSEESKQYVQSK